MRRRGDGLIAALDGALAATLLIAVFAAPAAALEIKRSVLPDGAVLLVSEQHQLPMVTMTIALTLPVVLFLVWILNYTLAYVPPVLP